MLIMCTVSASAQYYMNVYKDDGQKYQFLVSDIDSVSMTQDIINNSHNGHEYVDLGFPSGLKWAACNVGANTPEEYGNYYAWGEIVPKTDYSDENCATLGKQLGDISGNANYDAATANWGAPWRMPTREELKELIDNCTFKWTTQNGTIIIYVFKPQMFITFVVNHKSTKFFLLQPASLTIWMLLNQRIFQFFPKR